MPLLGYPDFPGVDKVIQTALADISHLEQAEFAGALVDNHAHPHVVKATPEMIACFAAVMKEVVAKSKLPVGVQFLIDDPQAALLIAKVSDSRFIRTDFFVDKVENEYGIIKPEPEKIIRYREVIGGQNIMIWADIQVKHARMLEHKSLATSARQAIGKGADAVIVTGKFTGVAPRLDKLVKVKKAVPGYVVLVGSGLNKENCQELMRVADGALVGTAIRDGSRIDLKKAKELMKTLGGNKYGSQ